MRLRGYRHETDLSIPHAMTRDGGEGRFALSLRGRLLAAALVVMIPLLLGAGVCLALLSHTSGSYAALAREVAREEQESVSVLQRINAAQQAGSRYMEGGDVRDLIAYQGPASEVDGKLASPYSYDTEVERRGVVAIRAAWKAAKRRLDAYRLKTGQDLTRGTGSDPEDAFQIEADAAAAGVERLMADSEAEVRADLAETERLARLNWALGLATVAIALLLAGLLANRVSKTLVRPLHELARAARSLGNGHLEDRVSIRSTKELNEVAGTFNAMAKALQGQREELERHAFADALTGLPNRALFEDRARHAIGRLAGGHERVAVLVLDIDGFKLVNDGLGRAAGDALLMQAAERMSVALRPSDTIARLGSDEFGVLLESVRGLDDALGASERLRDAFDSPFILEGSEVLVTASVGIALSTEDAREGAELLRRAGLAMHRIKGRGRNASEFFDPGMDDQAAERLTTLNALRRAIDRGELVVHYQPIVDLNTGEMRAAEALLRWDRPGRGLVPPLEFIPLAEETGLIVSMGAWVLNAACAEAKLWEELAGRADIPVTVNVSARQLLDEQFEATVAEALRSTGLSPEGLILEVTESSVIQSIDVAIAKLDRISATGVRIALDDFGEGYSSLSHLRELPIDILKIARPFVRELTEADHDPALVRGIVELARSLGLRLVAEGIELPEQQEILLGLDCPLGQGFLFARPMESTQLRARIGERRATQAAG
ncbi:MAG: hypothetical protein QOH58_1171 [Thermoleophilaceae bacterium]|jgi:diguanylate cyclase (GGDEF)-like protein|nr:hypothetical protein [Thermoleophilaceae bacterium]